MKKFISYAAAGVICFFVSGSDAGMVFEDTFDGADGYDLNNGLTSRQSGSVGNLYYGVGNGPNQHYQLRGGTLYHDKTDSIGGQIFLLSSENGDANKKNFYMDVCAKKYEVGLTVAVDAASVPGITDFIKFYWNDAASAGSSALSVEHFYNGSVRLFVDAADSPAYAGMGPPRVPVQLRLFVDETVSPATYEFFVNGNSVKTGMVTFKSRGRYPIFQMCGTPSAWIDNFYINVSDSSEKYLILGLR